MNSTRGPQEVQGPNRADRFVSRYLAPLALVGGLLLILFVTLNRFIFVFRTLSTADYFNGFLIFPSSYLDFPLNVLLFTPFGFGLASLLDQARLSKKATFSAILLAGFLLTWLVESLQFFLPGRTPNYSDLIANTLGALLGLACFRAWQDRRRFLSALLQPRYLVLSFLIYLLLLSALGFTLRERARLDYWRVRFPLAIGNELTGNRPWKGEVSDLLFLERALPKDDVDAILTSADPMNIAADSLVAYYPLQDAASLVDETGNLPDLRWRGESGANRDGNPQQIDGNNWLETGWAVVYLAERFEAASQFTIKLSVTTADLAQTGPARILTISTDPFYRNLMLGQEGQDLIVRVRMPLTGVNGARPELKIPDIFTDDQTQTLIVTYDSLALTVYVDETEEAHQLDIVPGVAFFFSIFGPFAQTLTVNTLFARIYMILFYLLVYIPIGITLALIVVQYRSKTQRILLLVFGILLPTLLLELIFSARTGFELRPVNILLSAAIIALTFQLLAPAARKMVCQWGSTQL